MELSIAGKSHKNKEAVEEEMADHTYQLTPLSQPLTYCTYNLPRNINFLSMELNIACKSDKNMETVEEEMAVC